jgi:hypothetical protein
MLPKKTDAIDDDQQGGSEQDKEKQEEDTALGCCTRTNPFRKLAINIVGETDTDDTSKFDQFILIIIAVSSLAMFFENPLNDPEGLEN